MRYAQFLCVALITVSAGAADWLVLPGPYTHDAVSGQRVEQYQPVTPPTAPLAVNFRSSGYTHTRSSLNYGASADHYHRVERWGDPVRPYGEWRFPYRPYSTPYYNWGPPFAGFNLGFGGGFRPPNDDAAGVPPATPFQPYPVGPGSPYRVPPYYDGYYPNYR